MTLSPLWLRARLLTLPILPLAACGDGPQDRAVEYYLIDDDTSGDARQSDGNGPPASNAAASNGATLTFVSPSEAIDGGGVISVVIDIEGAVADATWGLAFDVAATSTAGTPIIANQPLSTTAAEWDTAALAPAAYYLFADLLQNGVTTRFRAPSLVTVATGGSGNAKPRVTLAFPTGEQVLVAGVPQAISYSGQDADGDTLKYKVEYTADGGGTWTVVADNLTATSYEWDVAGLSQGTNYRVRVTAADGLATGSTVSAKAFGVATAPVTFTGSMGAMLTARCSGCHAAGAVNANVFRSDTFDLAALGVSDKAQNIKTRIENNTMPPAAPLAAADKAVLTLWVWGGSE